MVNGRYEIEVRLVGCVASERLGLENSKTAILQEVARDSVRLS